jgi:uncharacterized membrane protein
MDVSAVGDSVMSETSYMGYNDVTMFDINTTSQLDWNSEDAKNKAVFLRKFAE